MPPAHPDMQTESNRTMGFSTPALHVLEDFSRSMGFHRISPADDGSVTFALDRAGLLCFTPAANGNRILVSLKRQHAQTQADDLLDFFRLSRWDSFLGVSINAGMSADNGFVLVANLHQTQFSVQLVEACVDQLISLHDGWLSA